MRVSRRKKIGAEVAGMAGWKRSSEVGPGTLQRSQSWRLAAVMRLRGQLAGDQS